MLSDLAFALAEWGHEVIVITSRQRYDVPEHTLPARETICGVKIHRVDTSHFGRHNLIGRAVDYATFYLSAVWVLWRIARKGDVVVANTDPPMLSVIAGPIASWRGATLVNWLQDIFPEVAEALGVGRGRLSHLAYAFMRYLRNRSLRSAAMNVVLGEHMANKLACLGVAPARVLIIPNWADGELIKPQEHSSNTLRKAWGLEGKFVVGYSGNLGRAHEYRTLLHAIERLGRELSSSVQAAANGIDLDAQRDEAVLSRLVWLFIGGGALYLEFEAEVRRRKLPSVIFKPYQPREYLAKSLSVADVHQVSLRPELEGFIVPSKVYGIAAAGRPTVFIGDQDGEVARLISKYGCGHTVSQGDEAGLAAIIRALADDAEQCQRMGENARRAFEAEFNKPIAIHRWNTLLIDLANGG